MNDNVVINVRERPLSTDINDAQALGSRMLATFLRMFGSDRRTQSSGQPTETGPRSFTSGLDVVPSGSGTTVTVNPGMLAQYSLTHPAASATLEDSLRLGYLHEAVVLNHVGTPNTSVLLEMRVVDVTTATESRDVMNATTGLFVPTSVPKRIERRIEFQWVDNASGTSNPLPVFSGGTWEPLCILILDSNGEWLGPSTTYWFLDCRNDIRDLLDDCPQSDPDEVTVVGDRVDAVVYNYTMNSLAVNRAFSGNFHGRVGPYKAWLRAAGNQFTNWLHQPNFEAGFTPSGLGMEHLYLVPLISNGVEVMPRCVMSTSGAQRSGSSTKGALVVGDTAPARVAPVCSADFVHASGWLQNYDDVPASKCLHVATYYVDAGGTNQVFWTQNAAGTCYLLANPLTSVLGLNETHDCTADGFVTFDYRDVIPENARTMLVDIYVQVPASRDLLFIPYRFGGTYPTDSFANAVTVLGNTISVPIRYEIPAIFNTLDNTNHQFSVHLNVLVPGAGTATVYAVLWGWTF